MLDSDDDSDKSRASDDGPEQTSSQEISHSLLRPVKRRKVTHESEDEFDLEDGSPASAHNYGQDQRHAEDEEGSTKPKSKYKIHIPKNSELPADAFFTQPPQRSSSPYRIDQFHWRKPKRPDPQSGIGSMQPSITRSMNRSSLPTSRDKSMLYDKASNPPAPQGGVDVPEDEFPLEDSYEDLLADLPSDAFSSPINAFNHGPGERGRTPSFQGGAQYEPRNQAIVAPLSNLKQTTLFGTQAPEVSTSTQSTRKHNWPLANKEEPATHHILDQEALATWVYPTNLGTIRDYQYSIVAKGLYHNMLVALPTGLGKTFIAATIMLNWYRWTTTAQIVFVAPTKPLVSQQVKACFDIVGIPRSATTMLTGGISPGLRAEEWKSKRVFFMTPQTIVNDLKSGICDPKRLVLLVVDEAHRATGGYAYVEVVKFLKRFNQSFRVLALTATPGASVESVQAVIDGLGISRVEIRTEESIDIRQYVHPRKIDTVLFENSDEMVMIMDLFSKALRPVLDRLNGMNAYWVKDPMMLTPYGCSQARASWMSSNAGKQADFGLKGMVNTIFSLLASLSHGIELLKYHGIGPFYHKVLAFRNEIHANGKKGGKYARQINESEPFQTMISRVQLWINNPDFMGHPKLEYLQSVVMNHFLDAGEGRGASDPSSTKVMIFAHYRDSAEEIARVLRRNDPMIRPHVFVGQASAKGSEGMDQKKQLDIIQKFQSGIYNTLVATSIGEEGLDIGEIDLIICYDASASPIRMLQRMGRTGRKRAGNIVVTLMKGKEENNFSKAKDCYEKMQQEIAVGSRFNFHEEESRRIVPKNVQSTVDKRVIEIPPENTQPNLPEPTKRGRRAPKKPPKRFNMPDGVRTGFTKASRLDDDSDDDRHPKPERKAAKDVSPAPIPALSEVLLTAAEEQIFERKYLDIQGDHPQTVEVPRNDRFPYLQRTLRPTRYLEHGSVTNRFVGMLQKIHDIRDGKIPDYQKNLTAQDQKAGLKQAVERAQQIHRIHGIVSFAGRSQSPTILEPDSRRASSSSTDERSKKLQTTNRDLIHKPDEKDELSDFIDDDFEEDVDAVSSASTPPPLVNSREFSDGASNQVTEEYWLSEEELPEFGTMVKNAGVSGGLAVSHHTLEGKERFGGLRKGRRKVVDDDSDE